MVHRRHDGEVARASPCTLGSPLLLLPVTIRLLAEACPSSPHCRPSGQHRRRPTPCLLHPDLRRLPRRSHHPSPHPAAGTLAWLRPTRASRPSPDRLRHVPAFLMRCREPDKAPIKIHQSLPFTNLNQFNRNLCQAILTYLHVVMFYLASKAEGERSPHAQH